MTKNALRHMRARSRHRWRAARSFARRAARGCAKWRNEAAAEEWQWREMKIISGVMAEMK